MSFEVQEVQGGGPTQDRRWRALFFVETFKQGDEDRLSEDYQKIQREFHGRGGAIFTPETMSPKRSGRLRIEVAIGQILLDLMDRDLILQAWADDPVDPHMRERCKLATIGMEISEFEMCQGRVYR